MDVSQSLWYILQFHEEANSPYLYKFAQDQWLWFQSNTMYYIGLGKQIDTININKSNYTCYKDNSNFFMHCMENYYSKKLGCILPWASKNNTRKVSGTSSATLETPKTRNHEMAKRSFGSCAGICEQHGCLDEGQRLSRDQGWSRNNRRGLHLWIALYALCLSVSITLILSCALFCTHYLFTTANPVYFLL